MQKLMGIPDWLPFAATMLVVVVLIITLAVGEIRYDREHPEDREDHEDDWPCI